jgi:hypothetical protein
VGGLQLAGEELQADVVGAQHHVIRSKFRISVRHARDRLVMRRSRLDSPLTQAKAAHMADAERCLASWYVIYPVALLPRLERNSLIGRSGRCMRRGMPPWERLGRQVSPMRPRDCCYYHGIDWRRVAVKAEEIAHAIPLAAQSPPQWWPQNDSDEAKEARKRARQPRHDASALADACDLPEPERSAVKELLSPTTAIWIVHSRASSSLDYTNGRHRAQALMMAGVRWVPVIRMHCCQATEDCSPRYCYLHEAPLPAAHIVGCDLLSRP